MPKLYLLADDPTTPAVDVLVEPALPKPPAPPPEWTKTPPPDPPQIEAVVPPAATGVSMVPWSITGTPWQAELTTQERVKRAIFPFGSSLSEDSATSLPRVGLTIAYWYLLYRLIKKVL